ncbi:MAG: hypothetical protein RLZ28_971 [Actinomycetota bacterium]|jgi:threonine dehydratase
MTQHKVEVPTLADFAAARALLTDVVVETPVLHNYFLSDLTGQDVYLKCENLQRTGAYKVRGAFNRMSKLSEAEKAKGVIAASAGNHAQGVALAANKLGIKATIFMPIGVSIPKLLATRGYGAEVVLTGATFSEAYKASQEFAKESGAVFIPPFDNLDVIIGQGTVGMEIMDQVDDVEVIVVAIGGGGLAAGVAVAAKLRAAQQGRKIKVIGVQSEHAAAYQPSLKAGEPLEIHTTPTIADGIAVSKPGRIPFELIKSHLDSVVTVTENEIAQAILILLERSKQVVEPAGAVSVAAILAKKIKPKGRTVAVLSGGNMDPLLMMRVVRHGLASSERFTDISIMLPDRPGQLARTAEIIANANANVVEVLHTRSGDGLQIGAVELKISVETSGHEHRVQVVKALKDAGLKPQLQIGRDD